MKNLSKRKIAAKETATQAPVTGNWLFSLSLLAITLLLSSCEAIGDIFKAGMGVGIFLVLAVVVIIVIFVMRAGKK